MKFFNLSSKGKDGQVLKQLVRTTKFYEKLIVFQFNYLILFYTSHISTHLMSFG